MLTWMKNQISKLYSAVSAPVAATRDALSERLQNVCDTASLLYNRTMHHIGTRDIKKHREKCSERKKR